MALPTSLGSHFKNSTLPTPTPFRLPYSERARFSVLGNGRAPAGRARHDSVCICACFTSLILCFIVKALSACALIDWLRSHHWSINHTLLIIDICSGTDSTGQRMMNRPWPTCAKSRSSAFSVFSLGPRQRGWSDLNGWAFFKVLYIPRYAPTGCMYASWTFYHSTHFRFLSSGPLYPRSNSGVYAMITHNSSPTPRNVGVKIKQPIKS